MTYQCVICSKTTEDRNGWYLLQVSIATFIRSDGVDNSQTTTLYADSPQCLNTWCNRVQVEYEPAEPTRA